MSPFLITIRPWGLYLEVNPPMSEREAEDFNRLFEAACTTLNLKGAGWGALSDIRAVDICASKRESIVWYMHMARQCGAGRTSSLHADWRAAAVYAEALHEAGLAEQHRIVVVPDGSKATIQHAFRWVENGTEPPDQLPPGMEAATLREWYGAVRPSWRMRTAESA